MYGAQVAAIVAKQVSEAVIALQLKHELSNKVFKNENNKIHFT